MVQRIDAARLFAAVLIAVAVALAGCRGAARAPDDDQVGTINPCLADDVQVELQVRSPDLAGAAARHLVKWTETPTIGPDGTLSAAGTLTDGATLFDPLDGNGPAFSVHYGGRQESLVELIPARPASGQCWVPPSSGVTVTLAVLDKLQVDGAQFSLQATSPLFRDVGVGQLELRVWGTDAAGEQALLSSHYIAVAER